MRTILAASLLTVLLLNSIAHAAPPRTAPGAPEPPALRAFSDAFADVAERVKPSVVTIFSEKTVQMPQFRWPFGDDFPFRFFEEDQPRSRRAPRQNEYKQTGTGSGIVIDKEGHILTNNHVVDDTDGIKVKFPNGATFDAKIVGTDPRTDLAVLKLQGKIPNDLVPAVLGDSDGVRIGEWVLAIGAPFGFEQTVTAGIISASGRNQIGTDRDTYGSFLQTDAAINRGNSGGPLVNLRGEVVGINTAIISPVGQSAGVGFAIPASMAQRVMRDLLTTGRVTRGYLGVMIQDLTPELAEQLNTDRKQGAVISQITKDAPATKAGLKPGDIIVRYNGQPVTDTRQLRNAVAETRPGTRADVVVVRDGKERTLKVQLGELPGEPGTDQRGRNAEDNDQPTTYGLTVQPLTEQQAKALGLEDESGILISAVENGSPAAEAGLRPGDLITEANRQPVSNLDEFRAAVGKAKGKLLLLVKSREGSRFVVLQAGK